MLRALNQRGALGTHFSVGGTPSGISKYQYADLDRITFHGGAVNKNSLGMDIIGKPVWYSGSENNVSKRREVAIAALKLAYGQQTASTGVIGLLDEFVRRAKVITGLDPRDYKSDLTEENIKFDFLKPLAEAMGLPDYLITQYLKKPFNRILYDKEPFYLDTIGNLIKGGTSKRLEKLLDIDTLDAVVDSIKLIYKSAQLQATKSTAVGTAYKYNGQLVPGRSAAKASSTTLGFPSYDEKAKVWSVGVSVSADDLVSGKNSQGLSYAGIVAHGSYDDSRTDGRVAEFYSFLRLRKGFGKQQAYIAVKGIYAAIGARDKAKDLGIFDSSYKLQGPYKNIDTWKAHSLSGGRPIPKDTQIKALIDYHQTSSTKTLYSLGAYPGRIFKMEIK